ncbi:hypothetical protein FHN55_00665 [Streptomyces sp. NP160]|uniref:hypothetical protein n=1 Tax=Streptomyces sp. NP160 TaxID=2586637 RepID=UPI001117BE7D|nr:hypothetical protein [Streptomyces sp. NP160]TNM70235.1 hypothetical protein FHN55_00665 [Streptomyces sp. NP160]
MSTPGAAAGSLGAVALSGAAAPVVHQLVGAVSSSAELAALDLHEQLEVLAAVSEPWRHAEHRRHSGVPEVLAQALGGQWPSRVHAGLSDRRGDPVAPHQLPHLADDVTAVLDGGGPRREQFVAEVVRLVREARLR